MQKKILQLLFMICRIIISIIIGYASFNCAINNMNIMINTFSHDNYIEFHNCIINFIKGYTGINISALFIAPEIVKINNVVKDSIQEANDEIKYFVKDKVEEHKIKKEIGEKVRYLQSLKQELLDATRENEEKSFVRKR